MFKNIIFMSHKNIFFQTKNKYKNTPQNRSTLTMGSLQWHGSLLDTRFFLSNVIYAKLLIQKMKFGRISRVCSLGKVAKIFQIKHSIFNLLQELSLFLEIVSQIWKPFSMNLHHTTQRNLGSDSESIKNTRNFVILNINKPLKT